MTKKTVFMGHPIGGDVKNNVEKVLKICAEVHFTRQRDGHSDYSKNRRDKTRFWAINFMLNY